MKNRFLKLALLGVLIISVIGVSHTNTRINTRSARNTGNRSYISIEKAKSIALNRVKGANSSHVRKLELDYENGRPVYEGEIHYNGWEYDFDIDAVTGKVLKWERERD